MKSMTAIIVSCFALLALPRPAHGASESVLQKREQRQLRNLHRYEGTLRFFRHHAWLLRGRRTRHAARQEVRRARIWIPIIRRELAETRRALAPPILSVPQIICKVFVEDCQRALSVAYCESKYSVHAVNGQYYGLFQMGSREREIYGGSTDDPWEQARAAHAYYLRSGWAPWSCA